MRIDSWLLGIVVFGLVIVLGVMTINDVNTNYASNISTSRFTTTYDIINDTYDLSQDMKNATLGGEISDDESWQSMVKGAFVAIRFVKNTFKIAGDILSEIMNTLPIPPVVFVFALTALTLVIIFALLYLIWGRTPPQ